MGIFDPIIVMYPIELFTGGGIAAVTIVMVQLLKPLIPAKYVPLATTGVGVILGMGISLGMGEGVIAGAMTGLVIGLSAAGLYDHKSLFSKKK